MHFSYVTAHTDTEGESEEEKGWISSSASALTPEEKIELFNLLQQVDTLHCGSDNEKRESFRLLLENEEKVQRACAVQMFFSACIFSTVYDMFSFFPFCNVRIQ